jgi:twinkle protein
MNPQPTCQQPAPLPAAPAAVPAAGRAPVPLLAERRRGGARRSQGEEALVTELTELLLDRGISLEHPPALGASQRMVCPECGGGRSGELSLSVTLLPTGAAVWNCFRATCGWAGGVHAPGGGLERGGGGGGASSPSGKAAAWDAPARPSRPAARPPDTSALRPLEGPALAFLAARGLSRATLNANHVRMERRFMPAPGGGAGGAVVDAVAFPYLRRGSIVNVKYRAVDRKAYTQVRGGEQTLYGLDDVEVGGAKP